MKNFDELLKMTEEEKQEYLRREVEKIISEASRENVLKLRLLQAKIDSMRSKIKNPIARANAIYNIMMTQGLNKLNEVLNG